MPLPLIVGGIAAVAGVAGVGNGIRGGMKMKDANDTMKIAEYIQTKALNDFDKHNNKTTKLMDELGMQELNILATFDDFSDMIEKIQGRPEFKAYSSEGINLPEYEAEELKKISVGADALITGVAGAAAGTAGGVAAAGATTTAVMALGTASTGTAISTLSGAAATNATLAALGGGSLAAGGGGMALGSAVLSGATLGVGLLVSGVIVNVTGSKLSSKADEAYSQAKRTEKEVEQIVGYLERLYSTAADFKETLSKVEGVYRKHLSTLDLIINFNEKTNWSDFTEKEKRTTENAVMLVGLLYKMCQTSLVTKQETNDVNKVNKAEVIDITNKARVVLDSVQAA